jgi:putative transposase
LGVLVTKANASERLGAVVIFDELRERLGSPEIAHIDQGYSGENFARALGHILGNSVRVEVAKRSSKEFELLAKRWVVERTCAWLNHYRRLSKDYELYTEMSEAMIYGALIPIMLGRIAS